MTTGEGDTASKLMGVLGSCLTPGCGGRFFSESGRKYCRACMMPNHWTTTRKMPMNDEKTDYPYPSEINPVREARTAEWVLNRQERALEASRLAVNASARQDFSGPEERADFVLELADRLLVFILGE